MWESEVSHLANSYWCLIAAYASSHWEFSINNLKKPAPFLRNLRLMSPVSPACETIDDESERVKQFRQDTCDKLEVKLIEKGEKLSDLLLLYPPLCTVRSAIIEHLSLG